jgi:hypothetical protein
MGLGLVVSTREEKEKESSHDYQNPIPLRSKVDEKNASSSTVSYDNFWQDLQIPFQNHSLPHWIIEYISWHDRMRRLFPGTLLWTHPHAPNILLRYCAKRCGGLHDRLGNLPWDLYLANQTRRIYMILWFHPFSLQDFLQPPAPVQHGMPFLNWTVPWNAPYLQNERQVKRAKLQFLFSNKTFRQNVSLAIAAATTGELAHEKVLLHQFLGHLHEEELEHRLQQLHQETDMIHHTPSFGKLFHTLFQPVPSLMQRLQDIITTTTTSTTATHHQQQQLQQQPHVPLPLLQAYHYAAVHCRVRHPRNFKPGQVARGKIQPGQVVASGNADKAGLLFEGELRLQAIAIAQHAVQCTMLMQRLTMTMDDHHQRQLEPIYFFADSEDLVHYMVHQDDDASINYFANSSSNSNRTTTTITHSNNNTNHHMAHVASLVSRPLLHPTVHLDRQWNASMASVQDIFLDLYIAMGANCVAFGIGNFGYMASKLSFYARQCRWQHQLALGYTNDFVRRQELVNRVLPGKICTHETIAMLLSNGTLS